MCEVVRFWNAPRARGGKLKGSALANAVAHVGSGWHYGLLVKRGRKTLHLILLDTAGIKVAKLPLNEERNMEPTDYSVAKAKKRFRAMFKVAGGTKEARRHLRG